MSHCNHEETTLFDRWKHLWARPHGAALRNRLAQPIAFIRSRLSPTGYLGLHLTLGALTLIGAGWLFGGIAEDVVTGDPLTIVDAHVAAWFHARAIPLLTLPMLLITNLHGTWGITLLSLTSALVLIRQRAWYWLQALVLVMPGGMLLNVLTKHAFGRARPNFAHCLSVVLAGLAESTAWLALCLTAMHALSRHRGAGHRG